MNLNDIMLLPRKHFKVAAVSSNRGSFGHNEFVIMAADGEAWKVQHIQSNGEWKKGGIISIPFTGSLSGLPKRQYVWGFVSVECPGELSKAPQKVIDEVWD